MLPYGITPALAVFLTSMAATIAVTVIRILAVGFMGKGLEVQIERGEIYPKYV